MCLNAIPIEFRKLTWDHGDSSRKEEQNQGGVKGERRKKEWVKWVRNGGQISGGSSSRDN